MEYLIVTNDLDKKRITKELRRLYPFLNVKILGYRELIRNLYFDYSEETIFYIVEKYKVIKEIAINYLENLYYINFEPTKYSKISFLQNLYQELVQENLLKINPLWKENLKQRKIIFYHVNQNDNFFQKIIRECQKITMIELIDFQIKETQNITLTTYFDIENEVIGVCNKICDLIKNGKRISEIYLTNLSDNYRHLFETYASFFHLPINLKEKDTFFSSQIVTTFQELYSDDLKFTIEELKAKYTNEEEQEVIEWIISICNKFVFIKDERKKKDFILEELKNQNKTTLKIKSGIQEIDFYENEIPDNAELFILGTNESLFPKLRKDESYLTDAEMYALGWNTTSEKNSLEKERCIKKLKSFSTVHLSYPKKDGKIELYPSSILEEISYEKKEVIEAFQHSHIFNVLELGKKMDQYRKYGTKDESLEQLYNTYSDISYNSFKNDYTKVKLNHNDPLKLSYSSLDTFFHCSFKYYLDYILHLNSYEETFSQKIGTLFHAVLKEYYDSNFDFELSWQKNTQDFSFLEQQEYYFLNKLKEDLKRIINTLTVQEEGKSFNIKTEEKISIPLTPDNMVQLNGIIDKIFWKEKNGESIVSIVDYKTGNPTLSLNEVPYGINLQLPIYLLLLHHLPFKNIKVIGFYLQKILPSIPERDNIHSENDLKIKNLMLQGYSTDEEILLKEFDPTYEDSKLIKSMKLSSKGFYPYSKVLSEQKIKKLAQITLDKVKEASLAIQNGDFAINPKRLSNELVGCTYCNYQSICFRQERNIVNLKELKASEFLGDEVIANMDERTK
ncbi:MAG: hypothetical protein HFI09_00260 [Bacilli bacterium]|nr:hypothetical protein [Bacilli bacterium]